MFLNEGIEDFAYYVDVKKLKEMPDEGEFIDILFDDYRLDAEFYDKNIVKIYAPSNRSIEKLEDILLSYGASEEYINSVIEKTNIHENKKFIYKNMKHGFNERRLMNRRLNESFRGVRRPSYEINMFGDFDPIFEAAESAKDKKECNCRYKGKMISKMDKTAKRQAKDDIRAEISELKKTIKDAKKAGKSTKAMEAKLEKLQYTLDCLMGKCEKVNESVISSFRSRRRLFESDDENENDDNDDLLNSDDENSDNLDDEAIDNSADDKDEYEDVEMKAVVLTVLKKNVDTVKNAMTEAGVNEDDINIDEMDDDASDDDKVDIRVEVNSIDALTKYLESVGINLEDELGGEVVSSGDEDDSDNSDEDNSDDSNANDSDDEFSDADFDDLFAED